MIDFWHDWSGIFRPREHNWIDFDFIRVAAEYDRRFGNVEWHIAILGLHVRGTHNLAAGDAELQSYLQSQLDALESGELMVSLPVSEYETLKAAAEGAKYHAVMDQGSQG